MKFLNPDKACTLLRVAQGDRLEALYRVALSLGLLRGEALGLRWEDVDFDKRTLTVAFALQELRGKPTLVEPKTAKSRRTIPLPGTLVQALQAHRARQLQERLVAGVHWQEHGLVFSTTLGTPM